MRECSGLLNRRIAGAQRDEMIRKMDKRLKTFAETGLRYMEALDAIKVSSDDTSEQQVLEFMSFRLALQRLLVLCERECSGRQTRFYMKLNVMNTYSTT